MLSLSRKSLLIPIHIHTHLAPDRIFKDEVIQLLHEYMPRLIIIARVNDRGLIFFFFLSFLMVSHEGGDYGSLELLALAALYDSMNMEGAVCCMRP